MNHPIQPLALDEHGTLRFVSNILVEKLLEHGQNTGLGLNQLAMEFNGPEYQEDWEQLAQLIGYSLSGFGSLSYVRDQTFMVAQEMYHDPSIGELKATISVLEEKLNYLKQALREPVSRLYECHPDDLLRLT